MADHPHGSHPLDHGLGICFPFASDLWESATWQETLRRGPDASYGKRTASTLQNRPALELYDLSTDPDEIHNLAADPASAKLLEELRGKIKAFQEKTADPWLVKWDHE